MMEWLAIWGAAQLTWFVFLPMSGATDPFY